MLTSVRRSRPGYFWIIPFALLLTLAGSFLWSHLLFGSAEADHIAIPPDTVKYNVSFDTTGQSMWGPGPDIRPGTGSLPIFDVSWNETGTIGDTVTIGGQHGFPGGTFGGSLTGNTNGRFAMGVDFNNLGAGGVAVHYPVQVTLTKTAKDQKRKNEQFTITSDWRLQPGASLTTNPPSGRIDLTASARIGTSLSGQVCVFVCASGNIIPPISTPELTLDFLTETGLLPPIFSIDRVDIAPEISFLTGISGHYGLPSVNTSFFVDVDGRTLVAQGTHDNFIDLFGDLDDWANKASFGVIPPLGISTPPLRLLGTDFAASVDILDFQTNLTMDQTQEFRFLPEIRMLLEFD